MLRSRTTIRASSSPPPPSPTPPPPQQQQQEGPARGAGAPQNGAATTANVASGAAHSFSWPTLLACLFVAGAALGPPLDGIHSVVGLQVYDVNGGLIIGGPDGLYTSVWVFPLLGLMYSVVGGLQLLLDQVAGKWLPANQQAPRGSWLTVLSNVGALIGLLRLSSLLFSSASVPSPLIFLILAFAAHANWFAFDRTPMGYLLAVAVAVGAPLSEVVLIKYFGLWHYTEPDVFIAGEGLVSWTFWCYFFYTQWVATVARTLAGSLANDERVLNELK